MNMRYKKFFDDASLRTVNPKREEFILGSRFYALRKTRDVDI